MEEQQQVNTMFIDTPLEIFDHFGTNPHTLNNDDRAMLKDITEWAMLGSEDFGSAMKKLKEKELELGSPRVTDKPFSKVGRWIKLQRQIDSLKRRQEAV